MVRNLVYTIKFQCLFNLIAEGSFKDMTGMRLWPRIPWLKCIYCMPYSIVYIVAILYRRFFGVSRVIPGILAALGLLF